MRNIRNISIITIIVLSILVLIFKPYPFSRLPFFPISAFEAVPANAGLFFEMKNMEALRDSIDKQIYSEELNQNFLFRQINNDLSFMESLLTADSTKEALFHSSPIIAALQNSGSSELHFLFILETPSKETALDFQDYLKSNNKTTVVPSVFKDETVYDLNSKGGDSFSVSVFRNLILIGKYPLLVEDGIGQLKTYKNRYLNELPYRKVLSKKGSPMTVYCKPSNLAMMSLPFFNRKGKSQMSLFQNWDSWVGLDLYFEKDGLRFDGLAKAKGKGMLSAISKSKPVDRSKTLRVLPDNTAVASWMSCGAINKYTENGALKSNEIFNKYFLPWLSDHMAYVITEPYSTKLDAERFLLFATKDLDEANRYLKELGEAEGELKSYEYMSYPIQQIMTDNFLQAELWGEMAFKNPFITFIDQYLLVSQSQAALEVWIDKYMSGQVLTKQTTFLKYNEKIGQSTNFWQYLQPANSKQLLRSVVRTDFQKSLNEEFVAIENFYPFGLEIKKGGEVKGFIQHQAAAANLKTSVLWKVKLKGEVIEGPTVLQNPISGENEVWVQDKTNLLHVLNKEGTELWNRQLDGPLLSDINILDFYQGQEHHFLFNTAGKIYLVNNKGKDVGSFPIRLQSKATNGVLAVDFDGDKAFKFFIGSRNGNVYGFERTGRPLPGWSPQTSVGRMNFPLQHFQRAGKDYIVALNRSGKLYVFDRLGKRRFNSMPFKEKFLSTPAIDNHEAAPRIVVVDRKGTTNVVNLSGAKFKLDLGIKGQKDVRFVLTDVKGDARKDYLALSNNNLKGFYYNENNDFTSLFDTQLKDVPDDLFAVKIPGKKKSFIGTYSKSKRKINLYNGAGKKFKDFPLAGTTPFEIVKLFKNSENVLVVGNGSSVYAYRLR